MRIAPLVLGSLVLSACTAAPPEPEAEPLDAPWAAFARSPLVEVQIERRLYEQADNPHFLIRVRVTNRVDSVVGVDLRNAWTVFYPNQWGGLSRPARTTIDEEIMEPRPLTPALEAGLKTAYVEKALVMLLPGGSTEYFREFNASGRGDVDAATTPYLFVSVKGQLLVTDGERVENLLPTADALYLRTPVAWGALPSSAHLVSD